MNELENVGPGAAVGADASVRADAIAGRDVVLAQLGERDPLLAEAFAMLGRRIDAAQSERLDRLEDDCQGLQQHVYGNGDVGINERVRRLEAGMATLMWRMTLLLFGAGAVVALLLTLLLARAI